MAPRNRNRANRDAASYNVRKQGLSSLLRQEYKVAVEDVITDMSITSTKVGVLGSLNMLLVVMENLFACCIPFV